MDDDRDSRDATQIFLEAHGAIVMTASSVHDAVQSYEADPPMVVISDIGMPSADGYALARTFRERDAQFERRTSMIALTGFASASDRREALDHGFDAHLSKPVDLDELAPRIQSLVRMRNDD